MRVNAVRRGCASKFYAVRRAARTLRITIPPRMPHIHATTLPTLAVDGAHFHAAGLVWFIYGRTGYPNHHLPGHRHRRVGLLLAAAANDSS